MAGAAAARSARGRDREALAKAPRRAALATARAGAAAARAPHPDDRDAVPARVRRGDGLQRVLAARRAVERGGSGTGEFIRYLVVRRRSGWSRCTCSRAAALEILTPKLVNAAAAAARSCCSLLVLVPGFGVEVNGARRWFAAGPIQFQPSELMKLALVLYVARYLADHPKRMRSFTPGGRADRRAGRPGVPADRRRARPRHDARGRAARSRRC